jgi:hypothetical protein
MEKLDDPISQRGEGINGRSAKGASNFQGAILAALDQSQNLETNGDKETIALNRSRK